jgi:hypothetical protein
MTDSHLAERQREVLDRLARAHATNPLMQRLAGVRR